MNIKAQQWWDSLPELSIISPNSKAGNCYVYYPNRRYSSLKPEEIEHIWEQEGKPVVPFTQQEEDAIWGIVRYLIREHRKNPDLIMHRDEVFELIYNEMK